MTGSFLLGLTCHACGAPVTLVQSVSSGTDATAVAQCTACPVEWLVSMQLRRMRPTSKVGR